MPPSRCRHLEFRTFEPIQRFVCRLLAGAFSRCVRWLANLRDLCLGAGLGADWPSPPVKELRPSLSLLLLFPFFHTLTPWLRRRARLRTRAGFSADILSF